MINVEGSFEMSVAPDTFFVTIGVRSEKESVMDAQKEVNQKMNKIMEMLAAQGIPPNQIQTITYHIGPIYEYQDGKSYMKGGYVEHVLKITTDNVGKVGTLIDLAVKEGANIIQGIEYTVKNKNQYYDQALLQAIDITKEKAEKIAANLGATLYPIPKKIIEGRDERTYESMTIKLASEGTKIAPGLILIRASVSAVYQLNEE
ncbi:MAG: SIMPL domain-containing protein [Bacillaceae bacterium]